WLRLSAIVIAMVLGYAVAFLMGRVTLPTLPDEWIALPRILHVGLAFDWYLCIPLTVIFVVTALEAIGDMTATSDISGEPVEGPVYMERIKGGVLSDGINSMLAALVGTFPMSVFA
ncbi:solute carrier family 23 protein, partial [Aeromonas simiae]